MHIISSFNAADYLHASNHSKSADVIHVRELPGGVSNAVFLVEPRGAGEPFVLKQARPQLRVQEEWLCPVERIWREVETLRICGQLLRARSVECGTPSGGNATIAASVPRVLWEDRENFCYAMTAAPPGHRTWKELLLAGEMAASVPIATACGRLLGTLHAGSWNHAAIAGPLDDRTYFDQLRLDPYYRQVARVHPDLTQPIDKLIASVWRQRRCLVHGDFSPKNLLVWPGHIMLIDFEVGHFGDPAFDLGFFLTHLVLKGIRSGRWRADFRPLAQTFWDAYRAVLAPVAAPAELQQLERSLLANLAGCLLARVDGKSPVEYLTAEQRARVRRRARRLLKLLC